MTAKDERRRRRALAAYGLLQRAAELAAARVEAAVHPHGVSPSQCAVLEALAAHGPQHQQELATRLSRSKAQLTAQAEALEAKGLVHRERHPTDRRYMTVTLTDAGRALLAAVEPARVDAIAGMMAVLPGKQRARLSKACRRLVRSLGAAPAEAAGDGAGGGSETPGGAAIVHEGPPDCGAATAP